MAPANNVFPVVVKVVRETTRVLQVCGAPSYDRNFTPFLKQDPSVEPVAFFILRTMMILGGVDLMNFP